MQFFLILSLRAEYTIFGIIVRIWVVSGYLCSRRLILFCFSFYMLAGKRSTFLYIISLIHGKWTTWGSIERFFMTFRSCLKCYHRVREFVFTFFLYCGAVFFVWKVRATFYIFLISKRKFFNVHVAREERLFRIHKNHFNVAAVNDIMSIKWRNFPVSPASYI